MAHHDSWHAMFEEHFGSQVQVLSIYFWRSQEVLCHVFVRHKKKGGVRPTRPTKQVASNHFPQVLTFYAHFFWCLSIVKLYMTWKDSTCKYMKAKPLGLRDFWCSQQLNHGQQTTRNATPRRCLFLFQIPSCKKMLSSSRLKPTTWSHHGGFSFGKPSPKWPAISSAVVFFWQYMILVVLERMMNVDIWYMFLSALASWIII